NPFEAAKYRSIEDEGDGYKSYVGVCLSLMLGIKPIYLIDEPELCLHPPQAYYMGRFIGKHADSDKHATFVATHSSYLLRGMMETAPQLTIVRLVNTKLGFHAHLVPQEMLTECLRHPELRAEAMLDGVFAHGVAVVEGDGDRDQYQAAAEGI